MAKKRPVSTSKKKVAKKAVGCNVSMHSIRLFDSEASQTLAMGNKLTKMTINATCELAEPVLGNTKCQIRALVGSRLLWVSEKEETTRVIANCRYEVLFVADGIPEKEESENIRDMAIRICWPYNRSFLTTVVTQMGLPGVLLPLVLIDDKHQLHFIATPGLEERVDG